MKPSLPVAPSLKIKRDERVALVGATGSGKTTAALALLRPHPRLVVCDPKGGIDPTAERLEPYKPDIVAKHENIRMYVPPPHPNDNKDEYWESVFSDIFEAGDWTIYIDEMYLVAQQHSIERHKYIGALYTQGRQRGISVWAGTQRPVWVPRVMLTESSWYLCFRLMSAADRKTVADFMNGEDRETLQKYNGKSVKDTPQSAIKAIGDTGQYPYALWLYHTGWDTPKLYGSINPGGSNGRG